MTAPSIQVVCTLLIVAAMAFMAGPDHASPPIHRAGATVTRFVCVNCTTTCQLSSRGLFLHRAAVRRHISASKACFAADLGFKEIHVEALPCDVMAGEGGGWSCAGRTSPASRYTIR